MCLQQLQMMRALKFVIIKWRKECSQSVFNYCRQPLWGRLAKVLQSWFFNFWNLRSVCVDAVLMTKPRILGLYFEMRAETASLRKMRSPFLLHLLSHLPSYDTSSFIKKKNTVFVQGWASETRQLYGIVKGGIELECH